MSRPQSSVASPNSQVPAGSSLASPNSELPGNQPEGSFESTPSYGGDTGVASTSQSVAVRGVFPERLPPGFTLGDMVGKGASSTVYQAKLKGPDGRDYPVVVKVTQAKKPPTSKNHDSSDDDVTTQVVDATFLVGDALPDEVRKHELAAAGAKSTVASGVVHPLGVIRVGNQIYQFQSECAFTLHDCLHDLEVFKDRNLPLFAAIIIDFLRASLLGLRNFSEKGLVHNDIKPLNIGYKMAKSRRGKSGFCFLDYGSMRFYDEFRTSKELIGTQGFIAPEVVAQAKGSPLAADLWGVGQILHRLLEGCTKFSADNEMARLVLPKAAYEDEAKATRLTSIEELVAYQQELLNEIQKKNDFSACLKRITEALGEILPERRPALEILERAVEHLQTLAPVIYPARVRGFYEAMAAKVAAERSQQAEMLQVHRSSDTMMSSYDSIASFEAKIRANKEIANSAAAAARASVVLDDAASAGNSPVLDVDTQPRNQSNSFFVAASRKSVSPLFVGAPPPAPAAAAVQQRGSRLFHGMQSTTRSVPSEPGSRNRERVHINHHREVKL